jgi:ElaA protein
MINWQWLPFNKLSLEQLYDILALRQEVFVLEQQCFYTDTDYLDLKSIHLLGMQNNKLAAYLRVLPENLVYPNAMSFGRFLIAPFARNQGLAKKMMEENLQYFQKNHPNSAIMISAQLYLEKFYSSFGFLTLGEPYDDAGIMHIDMRRPGSDE